MQKKTNKAGLATIGTALLVIALFFYFFSTEKEIGLTADIKAYNEPLPAEKLLTTDYYVSQTFNNCAPAALAIALSYHGIIKTQEELAADLRPYNNLRGVNDDKSTPPPELGQKAQEYGLISYYRPNGTIELLKKFIANDMPVVVRTYLNTKEDYAHYRVIKGYDEKTQEIIQDDSYNGKNLRYSYKTFLSIWKPFNYEYLALVPPDKIELAKLIIGADMNWANAWKNSIERAKNEIAVNQNDIKARFNLVVSLHYAGDYPNSVKEFEKIRTKLTTHVLWYRIEPIQSYFELGNGPKVFSLSESILNNKNPAFSELYIMRGKIYLRDGKKDLARKEFEKAVLYNKNLKEARMLLSSVKK